MNILYVTSEAAPFAASGGLGDVMGALPVTVKKELGEPSNVSVVLPLYSSINEKFRSKMKMVDEFEFIYGWRHSYCGVYELAWNGVNYIFIDNEQYFMRNSLYGQYDDGERFAYFCRAVVEMMKRSDTDFDVVHTNDWQSALVVVYLKTRFANEKKFEKIKTVYTIHNIEYQGKYDTYILGNIFDLQACYLPYLEFDGCLNLMKGGIVCCDILTTVSPTYSQEILQPYFAYGLSSIISENSYKLRGIINGIDYDAFDPANKDELPCAYNVNNHIEGKRSNKEALQKELGLPVRPNVPMCAMITRLAHAKGVDLLLHIFDEMMQMDIQFVLLGTGDEEYEQILSGLCRRYPDKARALIKFDRLLSKRIYASADLFLMPSKSEPCGLSQMIACRYGALPVVRKAGGLKDTIIPVGDPGANGFAFQNFNAHELLFTVKDAVGFYQNGAEWDKTVLSAMNTDFTWDSSARKYINLYNELV